MAFREKLKQAVDEALIKEITRIRRHLHRYPELSFQEFETSRYICTLLDTWGIDYEYPIAGTGILASLKGEKEGPLIALRAELDALPIEEETGLEFSSENTGVMHACGHDMHMAALLGVIRVLKKLKAEIRGEVCFVFQPGEECLPGGAKCMLEAGVFKNRKPDMMIAQHVLPEMESGQVGFKPGMYMASCDEIFLTVKGKGGHAALPQDIIDPLLMASHILLSLHQEIRRRCPSGVPCVLSFGKMMANGAVNVIPDEVRIEGTFRTMNEDWRKRAHALIQQLASGIAGGMGGEVDLEIKNGYPALINHEALCVAAKESAVELLGASRVEELPIRMTADDFAWFSQEIPGLLYRFGVRSPGEENSYTLHTSGFRADEAALQSGITLMAGLALDLLRKNPLKKIGKD